MYINQTVKITIDREPGAIWDFATIQRNWTMTDKDENKGLRIYDTKGRPETGASFIQEESVGNIMSQVHGHFLYVQRPKIVVWKGIATYDFLRGLVKINIAEGGVFTLEKVGSKTEFTHTIYLDFPNSMLGRMVFWYAKNVLKLQKALYDHNYSEMLYIKAHLEGTALKAEEELIIDSMALDAIAATS